MSLRPGVCQRESRRADDRPPRRLRQEHLRRRQEDYLRLQTEQEQLYKQRQHTDLPQAEDFTAFPANGMCTPEPSFDEADQEVIACFHSGGVTTTGHSLAGQGGQPYHACARNRQIEGPDESWAHSGQGKLANQALIHHGHFRRWQEGAGSPCACPICNAVEDQAPACEDCLALSATAEAQRFYTVSIIDLVGPLHLIHEDLQCGTQASSRGRCRGRCV
jgi:hypothetical protein